ncbi:uncharacterized protein G2W53_007311 [Senna tora]|uniref:Uncharacterized protein n=1 Tax=Senna tora TaxID=362788 RepID=A0A835CE36_9FABA|nr:uncharacterized protein G2W53_007311 [Senna tora]
MSKKQKVENRKVFTFEFLPAPGDIEAEPFPMVISANVHGYLVKHILVDQDRPSMCYTTTHFPRWEEDTRTCNPHHSRCDLETTRKTQRRATRSTINKPGRQLDDTHCGIP